MKNINSFKRMKRKGEKIVMITAYDYPSGKYVQQAGVDVILVGDSLGMVIQGYENTLQVSLEDIVYHTKATKRGATDTFVIADMPFMSYHISLEDTKKNAAKLIKAGAEAVKLEGGKPSRLEAIKAIVDCEIPVVAHLGLTPQSVNALGGYVMQGKKSTQYQQILKQAQEVEQAGAFMLVLECVPEKLGKEITEKLTIPTIGIGAGRFTDGQVLVYHDILGMSDIIPKFVKQYVKLDNLICREIEKFKTDVKGSNFPAKINSYEPIE